MEQSSYQHHSINLFAIFQETTWNIFIYQIIPISLIFLFVICVPCPRSYCSLCHVNLYVLLLLLLLQLERAWHKKQSCTKDYFLLCTVAHIANIFQLWSTGLENNRNQCFKQETNTAEFRTRDQKCCLDDYKTDVYGRKITYIHLLFSKILQIIQQDASYTYQIQQSRHVHLLETGSAQIVWAFFLPEVEEAYPRLRVWVSRAAATICSCQK